MFDERCIACALHIPPLRMVLCCRACHVSRFDLHFVHILRFPCARAEAEYSPDAMERKIVHLAKGSNFDPEFLKIVCHSLRFIAEYSC